MTPQDSVGMCILDVRTAEEIRTAAINVPFIHIPLDELPARWGELPTDKPIAVLCHHGMRAQRASDFLIAQGLAAEAIVDGIDAWSLSVDGNVPRY